MVLGTFYPQRVVLFSLILAESTARVEAVLMKSGEISPHQNALAGEVEFCSS